MAFDASAHNQRIPTTQHPHIYPEHSSRRNPIPLPPESLPIESYSAVPYSPPGGRRRELPLHRTSPASEDESITAHNDDYISQRAISPPDMDPELPFGMDGSGDVATDGYSTSLRQDRPESMQFNAHVSTDEDGIEFPEGVHQYPRPYDETFSQGPRYSTTASVPHETMSLVCLSVGK